MADPDKEKKALSDFTKRVLELTRSKEAGPSVHADKPSEWQRPDKPGLPAQDRAREAVAAPFDWGRDRGIELGKALPRPSQGIKETAQKAIHGYAKWANPGAAAPEVINGGELDNMVGQAIKNATTRGPVRDVATVQAAPYDHRPTERRAAINTYNKPGGQRSNIPSTPQYDEAMETPDQRTQRFKDRADQRQRTPWSNDVSGLAGSKPAAGMLDKAEDLNTRAWDTVTGGIKSAASKAEDYNTRAWDYVTGGIKSAASKAEDLNTRAWDWVIPESLKKPLPSKK